MSTLDTPEVKNAVITRVSLEVEDHGFLTCMVMLDYGDSGQGFGGYVLYLPQTFKHHKLESVAGHFIARVMEVAGVDSWDRVVGRTVRARASRDRVHALGHIVKEDWFDPDADFAPLRSKA